jgi:hypothetical protein
VHIPDCPSDADDVRHRTRLNTFLVGGTAFKQHLNLPFDNICLWKTFLYASSRLIMDQQPSMLNWLQPAGYHSKWFGGLLGLDIRSEKVMRSCLQGGARGADASFDYTVHKSAQCGSDELLPKPKLSS